MPSNTIILSESAIDIRLAHQQARHISADDVNCEKHPAIMALTEVEREVWIMHCRGMMGIEIAEALNLRKDVVCRTIAGIRRQFDFLVRFRKVLESNTDLKARFCATLRDCNP